MIALCWRSWEEEEKEERIAEVEVGMMKKMESSLGR